MVLKLLVLTQFLEYNTKGIGNDRKIGKCNYIKLKRIFIAKRLINRMKRQPVKWEKILANYILHKGLISKIYKKIVGFNSKTKNKKQKNPKMAWLKSSQKIRLHISPKKTHKWPICIRKCVQHPSSSWKCSQNHKISAHTG